MTHNAAAKRKPNSWRAWYAHCSRCGWCELDCAGKQDAERMAKEHNRLAVAA